MISLKTISEIVQTRNANEVRIGDAIYPPGSLLLKRVTSAPGFGFLEVLVTTDFLRFPPPLPAAYAEEPWPDNLPLTLV